MDLERQFRRVLIYVCFNVTLFRSHLLRASCTFSTVSRSHNSHNNTHIGCWTKNSFFSPKMDGLYWKTLLKFMIWGYPYLWKHPYSAIQSWLTSSKCILGYSGDTLTLNFLYQTKGHQWTKFSSSIGEDPWPAIGWVMMVEPSCGSTLLSRHGWISKNHGGIIRIVYYNPI